MFAIPMWEAIDLANVVDVLPHNHNHYWQYNWSIFPFVFGGYVPSSGHTLRLSATAYQVINLPYVTTLLSLPLHAHWYFGVLSELFLMSQEWFPY